MNNITATPKSFLYPEGYILSDLFDLTLIETPNNWEPAFLMEISHQDVIIKIIPSYTVYYNNQGRYTVSMNGGNYYYNDNGYEIFASFEALGIYISNYCFQLESFNQRYFNMLLPKHIVCAENVVIDNEPSLDLYIMTKKEEMIKDKNKV